MIVQRGNKANHYPHMLPKLSSSGEKVGLFGNSTSGNTTTA